MQILNLAAKIKSDRNSHNLIALQAIDVNVTGILYTASHVAVYKLTQLGTWERGTVEGPIFVTERSSEPTYRIHILNRLSAIDLSYDITKQLAMEIQDSFLFLRKPGEDVMCIWFADKSELVDIQDILEQLKEQIASPPSINIQSFEESLFNALTSKTDTSNDNKDQISLLTPSKLNLSKPIVMKRMNRIQFRQCLQNALDTSEIFDYLFQKYNNGELDVLDQTNLLQ